MMFAGSTTTLEKPVLKGGWPISESAGQSAVLLIDQRKAGPDYLAGHPSLNRARDFTNAERVRRMRRLWR